MTSDIGLVGPVPAMVESRGFAPDSCFNIIDADFPLFSTYCSVLPQTTYSLPNFFGHQTKQEADALLSAMRTTLESGCFSSLRLFVCPLFFPPCGTAPVLPCARFCRGKAKPTIRTWNKTMLWLLRFRCRCLKSM